MTLVYPAQWAAARSLLARRASVWPPAVVWQCARRRQSSARLPPDFGFAFDVDGVLVRGSKALPHAAKTLSYLQTNRIPYVLLTNGGGYHEEKRAQKLTRELELETPLEPGMIIQSHTPFSQMDQFKHSNVLIVGGSRGNCLDVATRYGFKHALTPSDIFAQHPSIWPFSSVFQSYHEATAGGRTLPRRVDASQPGESLKIDAMFVYNDPRDWALDTQVILDCLLSRQGVLGTVSARNGDAALPNRGYQQDGQPPLYFSNPDLWFASEFALPRLGQGGFRHALEGVWAAVTGGAELKTTVIGKPFRDTYVYAEKVLNRYSQSLSGDGKSVPALKRIYMVGDNPESDIKGAVNYRSPFGSSWPSILVRTGVYTSGRPTTEPTRIVDNVHDAVQWALQDSSWAAAA